MVKLGRAMNPHDDNGDIKKVMHTAIGNGAYFYILALHYFFTIILLAMFIGNVRVYFLLGIFYLLCRWQSPNNILKGVKSRCYKIGKFELGCNGTIPKFEGH
jgi:hypothetical protein